MLLEYSRNVNVIFLQIFSWNISALFLRNIIVVFWRNIPNFGLFNNSKTIMEYSRNVNGVFRQKIRWNIVINYFKGIF